MFKTRVHEACMGLNIRNVWYTHAHILYMELYPHTYMYLYTYVCMYVRTYIRMYASVWMWCTHVCVYIYIYIYVYLWICINIYVYTYIYIYRYTHLYPHGVYLYTYIYIYMYIYIYIYIYMSVCVCVKWEWWVDIDGMSLHKTKLIQVEFLLRRDMWNRGSNMKVLVRKGKFMQDYLCNFKMTVVWGGHAEYGICAGTFRNVFAWKHDPAQYIALHL